jgi:hypothetical protein
LIGVNVQRHRGHSRSDACGTTSFGRLVLSVLPACQADMNEDSASDVRDFLDYLHFFANNDRRADLNGDGVVSAQNFIAFLQAFSSGCRQTRVRSGPCPRGSTVRRSPPGRLGQPPADDRCIALRLGRPSPAG